MGRLVVVNIGHHARSPRCERSALRVLGVFNDAEEATAHFADWTPDIDVHCAPLGEWFVMMRDAGCDEVSHLAALKKGYDLRLKRHAEEFESNRIEQRCGGVSKSSEPVPKSQPSLETGVSVAQVPRHKELRMQRFCVVSVLPDTKEADPDSQQPAVCVWDVFDTEEEARAHAKNVLSKKVFDYHLDVVAMYEWLFPTNLDLSQVVEEYRNEDLSRIMQHRKTEKERVENFVRLCEHRDEAVPEIVLGDPTRSRPILELTAGEGVTVIPMQ